MKQKLLFLMVLPLLLCGCGSKKDEGVSIHSDLQKQYLECGNYALVLTYANGKEEKSRPNPVVLKDENASGATTFVIYDGENEVKRIESDSNSCEVYNLFLQKTYTYKAISGTYTSELKEFKISDTNWRNLYIDGLTNVRDIGYLSTTDGGYVKPGMIYRSSRLNENETTDRLITDKGIKQASEDMKLKSELDIRDTDEAGSMSESYFGVDVKYTLIPFKSGGNYLQINQDKLNTVFEFLSHEENYPVDIHCSIGTDRTGAVCFLCEALLGVTEQDLYYDYLFSNFGNIGGSRTQSTIKKYLDTINMASGANIQEKTYNYLKNTCNVETSYIDAFINIMK